MTDTPEARTDRDVDTGEVEGLKRALDAERERHLRLLAEFDNVRRRSAREHGTARDEGRRAALLPVLPVLETLEQALAAGSTDTGFYEGVAATHRLLLNALREAGAVPIETVGRPFDPRLHEAVATIPTDAAEPGTILRELRRGWRLGDELLRPAQVEIASELETPGLWR
jgi:molecular chaperone GrpE